MKWFDIKNKNYWRVSGGQDYSIQEVSKITGITVRSLRNYLKTYENLLQPRRGYYNSLIFSAEDVQSFVMIKTLIKDGFKQSEVIEKVEAELAQIKEVRATQASDDIPLNSEAPVQIALNRESSEDYTPVEAETEMISIPPSLLSNLNETFIALEKRNAILENKLDNIEALLVKMGDKNCRGDGSNPSSLPRPLTAIVDSTQAFWSALKKAIP